MLAIIIVSVTVAALITVIVVLTPISTQIAVLVEPNDSQVRIGFTIGVLSTLMASNSTAGHPASNANDDNTASYWEGAQT